MLLLTSRKEVKQISKSIVLAVLCLCFSSGNVVYAQGGICQYEEDDINLLDGKAVLKSTKQPVNGLVCSHGISKIEYPYKNGKLEGIARWYEVDGKLYTEISFKDDKKDGVARRYHFLSGKLESETPYKDDKLEGVAREYYESGKLSRETTYKNDKKEGIERAYDESGRLQKETLYKNGVAQ
jgi:antitoxin component YwqK of YwqJK toxin-antitoxin module